MPVESGIVMGQILKSLEIRLSTAMSAFPVLQTQAASVILVFVYINN